MDILYVVMPAYNEEGCIEEVIMRWYENLVKIEDERCKFKLIVADSGSTDGTHGILEELCNNYPQIEILSDTRKEHGPKLLALYKYAIKCDADYIFQTDSDGQTVPEEFFEFWSIRNKYDAILGNRRIRGDGRSRKIVEDILCFILKLTFGIKLPDANAPFRLMRHDLVKKYIDRFTDDYNLPNVMLTTFFIYYKENISFLDISFGARYSGVNSINIPKIVRIGVNALIDFKRFKRNM